MEERKVKEFESKSKSKFKGELHSLDDNEIIKQILGGEKDLYASLVRKYNQRLFRIGLSIINSDTEVEEAMQTTYIKAYENLNKFKFQSSFSTWLTKIMVNESLMHLQKKKRSGTEGKSNYIIEMDQTAIELQTPLMKVLNSELKNILESSIRQLPEKYRTVFIMREMENMSIAETMECLSLSEANVKVRLNRSKVMLRNIIRGYLRDDEILQLYISHCDRIVDRVMEEISKRE